MGHRETFFVLSMASSSFAAQLPPALTARRVGRGARARLAVSVSAHAEAEAEPGFDALAFRRALGQSGNYSRKHQRDEGAAKAMEEQGVGAVSAGACSLPGSPRARRSFCTPHPLASPQAA